MYISVPFLYGCSDAQKILTCQNYYMLLMVHVRNISINCITWFTLFCIRIFGFYMCQWILVVFRIFGLGVLTCQKLYDPFCMFTFTSFYIYTFPQISQCRSDVLISITIYTVTKYVHFTQIFLDALKIYHD